MEIPDIQHPNHLLTIVLPPELYAALLEKAKTTGKTETELIIHGLQQVLSKNPNLHLGEKDRFEALESALEEKLKQYVESLVESLIDARIAELAGKPSEIKASEQKLLEQKSPERVMPMPTIRALQVGDRVLVLEDDSPYYMAKLLVIKTSLIRATVQTDTGERTFLKRDLRFVESESSPKR